MSISLAIDEVGLSVAPIIHILLSPFVSLQFYGRVKRNRTLSTSIDRYLLFGDFFLFTPSSPSLSGELGGDLFLEPGSPFGVRDPDAGADEEEDDWAIDPNELVCK